VADGPHDPLRDGLARHRGAAHALDAGRRRVEARESLERHPAVDAAKRPVVADVAHVGLVVERGEHRHAGDFSLRVEADHGVGWPLVADHAVGRGARAEHPAERDAVGRLDADHGGIARVGLDRHGVGEDFPQIVKGGGRGESAACRRAAEPKRERLRDRQAGERGAAHGVDFARRQGCEVGERCAAERRQEPLVALDRRHMVAGVAAGEDLDAGHAAVAVADDEQIRRAGKADRRVAGGGRLEDRAHALAGGVDEVAGAGE
jgi:hypothetical protein